MFSRTKGSPKSVQLCTLVALNSPKTSVQLRTLSRTKLSQPSRMILGPQLHQMLLVSPLGSLLTIPLAGLLAKDSDRQTSHRPHFIDY